MAKERGYVYYEADSIANLVNPFTDTNINTDNISIAGFQNPPLKVAWVLYCLQLFNVA